MSLAALGGEPGPDGRDPATPRRKARVGVRRCAGLALALAAGLASASRVAGQETIASDRPGIGSGSFVLAPGTFQLETGLEMSGYESGNAYGIGPAFLRAGVGAIELELSLNAYVLNRPDDVTIAGSEGFQPLWVGLKAPIARGIGGRMDLSVQGLVSVPSGSGPYRSDKWVPAVNALADISLSSRAAVAVNTGFQRASGGASQVVSIIVTPALSLGGGVGAYAGWAGFFTDFGDTHFGEAGLTYLASSDVQLDLNGGARDGGWFLGVGIAVRRTR